MNQEKQKFCEDLYKKYEELNCYVSQTIKRGEEFEKTIINTNEFSSKNRIEIAKRLIKECRACLNLNPDKWHDIEMDYMNY